MSSLVVRRARAVKPWLTARLVVLALELVLGVSAVAGGIGLLGGGAGMPESYLDHGGIQPVMLGRFFPLGPALVVLGAGEAWTAHWPAR